MRARLVSWGGPLILGVVVFLLVWAIYDPASFGQLMKVTFDAGWRVVSLLGFLLGGSLLVRGLWIHFHSPDRRGDAQAHTAWGLAYAVIADIGLPELVGSVAGFAAGAWGVIQHVHPH